MPHTGPDKFAATFRSKADALKLWGNVAGLVEGDRILAAICVRVTLRFPFVANLQLLHTFATERRQGHATALVLRAYKDVHGHAQYFRVSSEPEAVDFYRSLRLRFWGKQASGSLLCIHKIVGYTPGTGIYNLVDVTVHKLLYSGRRGSLVETFPEPR
jgi:hypothetical protein